MASLRRRSSEHASGAKERLYHAPSTEGTFFFSILPSGHPPPISRRHRQCPQRDVVMAGASRRFAENPRSPPPSSPSLPSNRGGDARQPPLSPDGLREVRDNWNGISRSRNLFPSDHRGLSNSCRQLPRSRRGSRGGCPGMPSAFPSLRSAVRDSCTIARNLQSIPRNL